MWIIRIRRILFELCLMKKKEQEEEERRKNLEEQNRNFHVQFS